MSITVLSITSECLHPHRSEDEPEDDDVAANSGTTATVSNRPAIDLRTRFQSIIEAVASGDLDELGDVVRYDVVDHNLVLAQGDGLPGLRFWAARMRQAMPDLTATVEDTLVDGNKLAARVTFAGTNSGDYMGVSATDAYLEFETFIIVEFSDGVVTQWWDASDTLPTLRQMGAELTLPPASGESYGG